MSVELTVRLIKDIVISKKANIPYQNFIYHTTGIFSIIAFLISAGILIHILYHYYLYFHKKSSKNKQQNKAIYVLFIARLIGTLFVCFLFAFVKSNYLSQLDSDQYENKGILYFIYYGNYAILQFGQVITFILFIYRIQIVFAETVYQYNKYVYISLYSSITIGYFVSSSLTGISHKNTSFIIFQVGDTNQLYIKASDSTNYSTTTLLSGFVFILYQIGLNLACLYMFSKKLVKLKHTLIEQYSVELNRTVSVGSPSISIKSPSATSINEDDDFENSVRSRTRTMTIDEVKQRRKKGNAADRIIKLHSLIKRHTILVWINVIGTFIFFVLYTSVSTWVISQEPLFVSVSNITVWLMFGCCDSIWYFTTKHCCCYICYMDKYCICCGNSSTLNDNNNNNNQAREKSVTSTQSVNNTHLKVNGAGNEDEESADHQAVITDNEEEEKEEKKEEEEKAKETFTLDLGIVDTNVGKEQREKENETKQELKGNDGVLQILEMKSFHQYVDSTRL